jgi:predicted HicB family RNase H-like nuclease
LTDAEIALYARRMAESDKFHVRVDRDLARRVKEKAKADDLSVSQVIRRALRAFVGSAVAR